MQTSTKFITVCKD